MKESFEICMMVDYGDSISVHGWRNSQDIENFIKRCAQNRVDRIFWRLSNIGNFNYPTKFDRVQNYSSVTAINNILEYLPKYSKKYNIKNYGWFTMYDEGWFPRYKALIPNVRKYYTFFPLNSGLYSNVDDLEYRGFFRIEKEFKKYLDGHLEGKYKDVIPSVEMGKDIPPQKPWDYYTQFARAHPEFLVKTREGQKLGRCLSYAYEEARNYRRNMIEEMLSYGLDGVLMDFTRWPIDADIFTLDESGVSRFGYEEPLAEGFKGKFGRNPLKIDNNDPEWIKYRADHGPTLFLKELKKSLTQKFNKKEICVMVFPDNSLPEAFLDVEGWIEHRLVDTVLPYEYADVWRGINDPNARHHRLIDFLSMGYHWSNLSQGKVKIIYCLKPKFYDEKAPWYRQKAISPRELFIGINDLKRVGANGLSFYTEDNLNEIQRQTIKMIKEKKSLPDIYAYSKKVRQRSAKKMQVKIKEKKTGKKRKPLTVMIKFPASSIFKPEIINGFLYKGETLGNIPWGVLSATWINPPRGNRSDEPISAVIKINPKFLTGGKYFLKIICWQAEISVEKTINLSHCCPK